MIAQLMRFGCVGALAASIHLAMVWLLVPQGMPPLWANVAAFTVAFQVTYYGHRSWTFRASHRRGNYGRMLLVSLGSFLLNEGLYAVLLQMTALDYRLALAIVLMAVSLMTFIASRLWVFNRTA